jgi:Flp pilus assembly protein TadD
MKQERWLDAIKLLKDNRLVIERHWELLWNLGWCYFKLERMDDARKYLSKAAKLAPGSYLCKFGLGSVYLATKQFKKAERVLSEALETKGSYIVRLGLALAYLSQGKLGEAERMHLANIKDRPRKSERYEAYADFLSDVGREMEAEAMYQKARELRRVN